MNKKVLDWKPYIPLVLKLVVIIWVASRLAYSVEANTKNIRKIGSKQSELSEGVAVGKSERKGILRHMQRMDSKLDKILEKL